MEVPELFTFWEFFWAVTWEKCLLPKVEGRKTRRHFCDFLNYILNCFVVIYYDVDRRVFESKCTRRTKPLRYWRSCLFRLNQLHVSVSSLFQVFGVWWTSLLCLQITVWQWVNMILKKILHIYIYRDPITSTILHSSCHHDHGGTISIELFPVPASAPLLV